MIKIKKIKHSKVILIFVAIFLLVLFIGNLSRKEVKSEANPSIAITILDINEKNKLANVVVVDALLEQNALPKHIERVIAFALRESGNEGKTLWEVKDVFPNTILIGWILEHNYSLGYRINWVIGDWIILVRE